MKIKKKKKKVKKLMKKIQFQVHQVIILKTVGKIQLEKLKKIMKKK